MNRPKITIGNIRASNNTNDGIRAEGVDLEIGNADVSNNSGKGINILDQPKISENKKPTTNNWNQPIIKIIIGVAIIVFATFIIAFLKHIFPF